MRTTFMIVGAFGLAVTASSAAQAKSEMQCVLQARQMTGEYDGLEHSQAKTACMLDTRAGQEVRTRPEVVILDENPQPDVLFSASRRVASGTWVRVSPNRWVLRAR
jgi:hypothetical protein